MTPGSLLVAAATCALLHPRPRDDGVSPVQKAHGSRPLGLVPAGPLRRALGLGSLRRARRLGREADAAEAMREDC